MPDFKQFFLCCITYLPLAFFVRIQAPQPLEKNLCFFGFLRLFRRLRLFWFFVFLLLLLYRRWCFLLHSFYFRLFPVPRLPLPVARPDLFQRGYVLMFFPSRDQKRVFLVSAYHSHTFQRFHGYQNSTFWESKLICEHRRSIRDVFGKENISIGIAPPCQSQQHDPDKNDVVSLRQAAQILDLSIIEHVYRHLNPLNLAHRPHLLSDSFPLRIRGILSSSRRVPS